MDPENDRAGGPRDSPVRPADPVDDLQTAGRRPERETGAQTRREGAADRTQRVVVGIDGSAESRAALHWAVAYAERTDAEVHAVAVWHQPLQFGVGAMSTVPDRQFEDEARGWISEAMPSGATDVHVDTHIRRGQPTTVLLDQALSADMLVVGNRGRGGFAGAMVGSVALRTAQHARCPVVLVPVPPTVDEQPPR